MPAADPVARPAATRWLLLIHSIPPKPDYFRVKIGRRLQRIGAAAIKNSVYALPLTAAAYEDFQWLVREIVAGGGEASVCEASFVEGRSDAEVRALFDAARDAEYRTLGEEAAARLSALASSRAADADTHAEGTREVARLKRRLAEITAIDFFGATGRAPVEAAIATLEARLRTEKQRGAAARAGRRGKAGAAGADTVRGRTWVTRRDVHVDRIASAWLIRRFIDPAAHFKFVPSKGYVPRPRELRFDMFEAEYTHEGNRCTFETLVARFALAEPALRTLGEIVHDIDLKDARFGRREAAGVEQLVAGIALAHADDAARVERGGAMFDDLYAALARPAIRPARPRGARTRHR